MIAFALAAVIISAPTIAKAASDYQIASHGTLVIKNADNSQYVEFYSEDIRYLQGEIDKLYAKLPGNYTRSAVRSVQSTQQRKATQQEYDVGNETIVTE